MSKIDYQALREAAEKATKGKWAVEFDDEIYSTDGINHEQIAMVFSENESRDAEFIAAANPATVLALLDERERNQQYIKRRDQENEDIALTVGKLRVELEAEKQRAKVLFMENARLKSGIAGLIHLGIRYADVEVMKIAGDAQLSTPCTDSIINSIATGIRIKGGE
ncbi:ead/Ea22-like family protein [Escherichia coli]|uniref:ead/Ea22-like family protein n=1 Tax=Escherichia coli TaxID=562 RepID=UPI002257C8AC|nr:ead/Ea22-like family protein [Escherichia coli]